MMCRLCVLEGNGTAFYVSRNEVAFDTVSAGLLGHVEGLILSSV